MPAGPPASIPSAGFAIPLSDSLVRQCIQMLLVGMKSHTHTHTCKIQCGLLSLILLQILLNHPLPLYFIW